MKQNLFGTDGIRGTVGIEPFTPLAIVKLGASIGQWAKQKHNAKKSILLGHDTRQSCSLVKSALLTGLLQHNVTIQDAGTIPTAAIFQQVKAIECFDVGIVISASHNPYVDNGIKLIEKSGKISLEDELLITDLFYQQDMSAIEYASLGVCHNYYQLTSDYIDSFASYFPQNFLSGIQVVLDCANGATYKVAQHIFDSFGAKVFTINDAPNGKNINAHCGALHLGGLQKAIIEHRADVGFAFDGDGDRVIAVNKHGNIKNGDDLLALLMQHAAYEKQTKIVGTVMTNQGFQEYITKQGKELVRVNVGDKYIAELLEKENRLIGGEQSGHIILRDYLNTGDGIFTALRTLQVMINTHNWDMTTFNTFPQVLINVPIKIKKDLSAIHFTQLFALHEAQLSGGRLLVRYSGTESMIRVMVEDADIGTAQKVGMHLSQELAKQLS